MIRRAGVIVSTILAAGLLSAAFALPAMATPKPDDPIISGDDRVIRTGGPNANSCDDAGLEGTIILKDDKPSGLTVTIKASDIPAGYDVTGIVVKGGPGFNVYPPNVLTNLRAPQNKGGQQPALSHWFVCGVKKTTTPPTQPPGNTPPGNTPPGNTPPGNTPPGNGGTGGTGNTPAAQGSTGAELADTGVSTTIPLIAGGVLVLLGGGLLFLLRPNRRRG